MPTAREIIAVLITAAVLTALALAITARPSPQAVRIHLSASQEHPGICDWRILHRLDRYTSWQYITPRLARSEHVGPCSKVITGTDGSIVFSQRGYVADES